MKIVLPPHHKKAERVKNWWQIFITAIKMSRMIDAGNFQGTWKEAAALSHAQVAEKPLSFFVINKKLKRLFRNHRVIINARIASANNPVKFEEACMSYPNHRMVQTSRYDQITVVFQVPTWYGGLKTMSMGMNGIGAYVVQHEVDHALGVHIYDLQR